MPTKLKNLKIKKVDFVDDGANPEAHIKLFKRKDNDNSKTDDKDDIQRFVDEVVKALKSEISLVESEQAGVATVDKNTVTSNISSKEKKGEEIMIDKSKLTEAERAFLESIEKRYSTETQEQTTAEGTTEVEKSASKEQIETQDKDTDNIYKGLNPAVKAELESLKKFKENAENKELETVAKKYEIIGKTKEELVPLLKSLKLAGGTAYSDTIAMLDNAVNAIEKSGIFKEIGKTGNNTGSAGANGEAWAKAEAQAMDIMKAKNITKAQALDEVFINNPELAAECEKEE